jgi:hypothetical protein
MSATTFMLSLAKFCKSAPKKKNPPGSANLPIGAVARFKPQGFTSFGTGFLPLKVKKPRAPGRHLSYLKDLRESNFLRFSDPGGGDGQMLRRLVSQPGVTEGPPRKTP